MLNQSCIVYVLRSVNHPDRYYTGLTDNVDRRLAVHNSGGSIHTASLRPWSLVAFADQRGEAMHKVAAPRFVVLSLSLAVFALVAPGVSACRAAAEATAFDPASAASSIGRWLPADREDQSPSARQGTRELLEIGASLYGYSLLWPSERCCAFTLDVKPDGRATAQVNVSKGPLPSQRRLAFTVSTEQLLRVQEVLDEARFFELPRKVGVVAVDGDVRKLRMRRGAQSHEVEIGESPSDAAAGTLEMRRAESVWRAVRSLIRIDEATDR